MSSLANLTHEQLDALTAERDAAIEHARVRTAERDRARCTCIALEHIASRSFQLLWEGVGDQSSHGEEMEWGRKVAAFLRESSADAGPDRLPLPAGWEESA